MSEITQLLKETKGVIVKDDILNLDYPMPLYSKNKDEVFVGRIREDISTKNGINMWVVSNNIRKGAAYNSVQIAEILIKDYI